MRKLRVKAHELVDVDVGLISLVKRPSTRIPFSIIKSEDAKGGNKMFDLAQVFARKSEASAPIVTSVIVKGEASEQMLKVLAEAGFTVEKAETAEGVTIYAQDVDYEGDVSVVKLNDTVALTVPVLKTAACSFAERCAAQGFYPSLSIATELLSCELHRAVEKADSPSAAAQKVQTVVADFGSFMTSLVSGLPSLVFKAEAVIAKAEAEAAGEPAAETPAAEAPAAEAPAAPAEEIAEAPADPQVAAVPSTAAVPAPTAETELASDKEAAPVDSGEHNSDAPAHEAPTNAIADASAAAEAPKDEAPPAAVEPVNPDNANEQLVDDPDNVAPGTQTHAAKADGPTAEQIADIVKSALAPLADRIAQIETGVQKAEEKLGNQVFGGVFDSGRANRQPAELEKSEGEPPLLDSGFRWGRE